MSATVTTYSAPPTVARFMRSNARVRLLMGPIGSAKTTACIMEVMRRAKMQAPGADGKRRTRWVVCRNTAQQLADSVQKSWHDWAPPGVAGTWRESTKTFTLTTGDVHAEVMFRALDDPDDVRRLLSLELTGFHAEEGRELPKEIIVGLLSRCGRYPSAKDGGPTWYGGIISTNPPSSDHWMYETFEEDKPEGWEIFKQPSGMSPEAENRENLPPSYYEDMMAGATDEWINVHVHGQYGRSKLGRPVYEDSWVHDFHTRTGLHVVEAAPVVIGLDSGRTPAAAFFQKDAKGRILMLDEVIGENIGMESFLATKVKPLLFERYTGHRVVVGGDPAIWAKSQLNETSVADIITNAGLLLSRRVDTSNRLAPRLHAVETLLGRQIKGEAMFLIDRLRCPVTVAGFEHGYRYRMKRDGSFELTPEKNSFSHIHDGIQYGAQIAESANDYAAGLTQGEREVEQVSMAGWT